MYLTANILQIARYDWVTRELHVKKSVLFFPQINWYDYVSGSPISSYYRVGVMGGKRTLSYSLKK